MFYSSINLPSTWCSYSVSFPVFEGKQLLILIPPSPPTGFCQITGPLKSSGWLVPGLVEWLVDWQALNERKDHAYPLLWLTSTRPPESMSLVLYNYVHRLYIPEFPIECYLFSFYYHVISECSNKYIPHCKVYLICVLVHRKKTFITLKDFQKNN